MEGEGRRTVGRKGRRKEEGRKEGRRKEGKKKRAEKGMGKEMEWQTKKEMDQQKRIRQHNPGTEVSNG